MRAEHVDRAEGGHLGRERLVADLREVRPAAPREPAAHEPDPQAVDLDALPVQVAHPGAEQVLELGFGPVDVAVGQVRRLREGGEHRLVLGPHGRLDQVADLLLAPLGGAAQDPPGLLEPPGGAEPR